MPEPMVSDYLKPKFSAEDVDSLQKAWNARTKIPEDKRALYEKVVKDTYAQLAKQYDPPDEHDTLKKLAGMGLDVANYGSGIATTGLGHAIAGVSGFAPNTSGHEVLKKNFVQDWKDALNPIDSKPAPTVDEWLKRLEIMPTEGGKLSDVLPQAYSKPEEAKHWYNPEFGGMLDPSARGAISTAVTLGISPQALKSGLQKLLSKETPALEGMTAAKLGDAFSKGAVQTESSPGNWQKALNAIAEPGKISDLVNGVQKGTLSAVEKQNLLSKIAGLMADPAGSALSGGGRAMYKSALKEADEAAKLAGKGPVSDVLAREGAWGGPTSLRNQASDLIDRNSNKVSQMVEDAAGKLPGGGQMETSDFLNRARFNLEEVAKSPAQKASAQDTMSHINEMYSPANGAPPYFNLTQLDKEKRALQGLARDSGAYNTTLAPPPVRPSRAAQALQENTLTGQAYADAAQSARRGVEDMMDTASPGMGAEAYLTNRDTSNLLSAEKAMNKKVQNSIKSGAKNSAIGAAGGVGLGGALNYLLMTGGYHPGMAIPAALGGAGAVLGSDAARTGLGQALMRGGPAASNALRSYGLEKYGDQLRTPSPWEQLRQNLEENRQ